jgi:thiosulfate/3-mercaptopyruvate sulfurtransferase
MPQTLHELNREPFLVSTDWLADHLGDPGVRLVDCRYYFDGRDGYQEYLKGHLPGAVHLDWGRQLTDPANPEPGTFKVPGARGGVRR